MIEDLSLEQKAALLAGRNFWATFGIEEAGIASIVLTDGPHGVRLQDGSFERLGLGASRPATCFPPAVAVASSWDPEVARAVGAAVAREARALGVQVVLGPGVNIKRSPLCGRNFEYYSEDPLLAGVLAAAHVEGQQAEGVGASVKHFAANNQETERMRVSAEVEERALREIYFPAFEHVVTVARPATVMCSYNKVNGLYASQHPWLLTTVLRDEWGFEGVVVSDWGAVHDPVASVEAGLDLEMPGTGGRSARKIVAAVRAGGLAEEAVDRAAARVAALVTRPFQPLEDGDLEGHHALARRLAARCVVVLKNDGAVLPLDRSRPVVVAGAMAAAPRYQGGGSSHIHATRVDLPLDEMSAFGELRFVGTDCSAIGAGDTAVVFAGLTEAEESEGFDRTGLGLPADQVELIRSVAAVADRTVVVLSNGGVVSLEGWHDEVDAIVEGFLLGQAGGGALADVLFGEVNPSGHLAETIPLRLEDTPSFLNFPGEYGRVVYGEGIFVGYRYYETVGQPVRYPFGHGLSYTTFETRDLSVRVTGSGSARASVTVANTGDRAGRHLVQLYVANAAGPVRRPARELRAFGQVDLEAGQERTVDFDLDRRAFAYWDSRHRGWVVAPGSYRIQIGADAATVVAEAEVALAGEAVIPELTLDCSLREWVSHPVVGPELSSATGLSFDDDLLRLADSLPMSKFLDMAAGAIPDEVIATLMERSRAGEPVAGRGGR